MRRMVLSSLVLLPALAYSQAGIASTSSATPRADLTRPTAPAGANGTAPPGFRGIDMIAADRRSATFEYAAMGDVPDLSAAQLTHKVSVQLKDSEMQTMPDVISVVVSGTVDKFGHPRNLAVTHSAGELVDKRSLEAVSQYVFVPATRNGEPVDSRVSVKITLRK